MSIIAILAALLFPSVNAARRSAQRATCVSNLRQIGLAIIAYVNDHDGMLCGSTYLMVPPMYRSSPPYTSLGYYLAPYLGASTNVGGTLTPLPVMVCPAFQTTMQSSHPKDWWQLTEYVRIKTYVDSSTKLLFDPFESGADPHPLAAVGTADGPISLRRVYVLGEVDNLNRPGDPSDLHDLPAQPVHGNVRNYLYLDAHVDSIPIQNDALKLSGQ